MKNDAIRSKEDAHELLRRLEQFYGEPVLPLGNFCRANRTLDGLHRQEQYGPGAPSRRHKAWFHIL